MRHMPTMNTKLTDPVPRTRAPRWTTKPSCQAGNCRQPARTRGYCPRHYQQILRHGRLTPEREYRRCAGGCIAEHCERPQIARGYCFRHYQQYRRYGHLLSERERLARRVGRPVTEFREYNLDLREE